MHTRLSKKTSPLAFNPEIEKFARRNRALHRASQSKPKQTTSPKTEQPSSEMSHHSNQNDLNNPINQTVPPQQQPIPPQPPRNINMPPPPPHGFEYAQYVQPEGNQTNRQPQNAPPPQQQYNPNQPPPQQFRRNMNQQFHTPPHNRAVSEIQGNQGNFQQGQPSQTNSVVNDGWERVDEWNDGRGDGEYYEDQGLGDDDGYEADYRYQQNPPPYPNRNYNHEPHPNQGPPQRFRQPHIPYVDGVPRAPYRAPIQGVESHFRPRIAVNSLPIVLPVVQGRSFEVRPQCLNLLPSFYGKAIEEPYLHLSEFEAVCGTIGGQGFTPDQVRLVLFQFTLKDAAKQWFLSLPSASIYTWQDLQQQFLDEYYTPQRTGDARIAIQNFHQQPGELFYEAFKRFKQLLRICPHHGIPQWELIVAFHDGLSSDDIRDINSTTNGTFLSNQEDVDWEFLEKIAVNSKRQAQTNRRRKHVGEWIN